MWLIKQKIITSGLVSHWKVEEGLNFIIYDTQNNLGTLEDKMNSTEILNTQVTDFWKVTESRFIDEALVLNLNPDLNL